MGGKHKQAQRVKNNARPSSSGRSAELLGASINPFVGFQTVKDSSFMSGLPGMGFASTSEDVDPNMDVKFQLVLKKMNKKDGTTKLKALQEFTELVKSSDPEAVKAVLPFWPRIYTCLVVDVEHRVREGVHQAHNVVAKKVKRNLAPYLKQLAGPWFTSQYDTYPPAASAAKVSFETAFPSNKLQEAIAFCQEEILQYICDNICEQSPETMSQSKKLTTEEAQARYERVLISSLQGYALYLNKLTPEQLKNAKECNTKIISNKKFWKLVQSKVPMIRAAWFGCITAICQNAPFLLENEEASAISAVFSSLNENEPTVLPSTWEAALLIVTQINDWHKYINTEKLVLPKLWQILREGGQGSATIIYPNLLPLLSKFPMNISSSNFYSNFFSSMQLGLKKTSVLQSRSEYNAIIVAYFECLRYVIMLNVSNIAECENLIKLQLIPPIEWTLIIQNTMSKHLYNEVATLLHYWYRNIEGNENNYKLYTQCFWENIELVFEKYISEYKEQTHNTIELINIIKKEVDLLLCLKRVNVYRKKDCKVTFVMEEKKNEERSVTTNTEENLSYYIEDLKKITFRTINSYLKLITADKINDLIPVLLLLIKEFDCLELFTYLNTKLVLDSSVEYQNNSSSLLRLYNYLFAPKIQEENISLEPIIDIIFTLYNYLNEEEKEFILTSLSESTIKTCLFWTAKKSIHHPYCNDKTIQQWLKTEQVTNLLVTITKSMIDNEITTDELLFLKQAINQTDCGGVLTHDGCSKICSILCQALLNPTDYPDSIDKCASFASHLSAIIYNEKTLLTYGDQLISALFSLSCNNTYDRDTISVDTIYEVNTSWQDVILLYKEDSTDLQNLVWKFTKIIQNTFWIQNSFNDVEYIKYVVVDLIRTLITKNDNKTAEFISLIKSILVLPEKLRSTITQINDLCLYAQLIENEISWTDTCPVTSLECLEENINPVELQQFLMWHQLVLNVLKDFFTNQDDNDEDKPPHFYLETSTDEINDVLTTTLYCYAQIMCFARSYGNTKLFSKISSVLLEMKISYQYFVDHILIPKNIHLEIFKKIYTNNKNPLWVKYLSVILDDLFNYTCDFRKIYNEIIKIPDIPETYILQLTKLFSICLKFQMIPEPKNIIHVLLNTASTIEYEENDVQIAEALTQLLTLKTKDDSKFYYNKNISSASWDDLQIVLASMKFLKELITHRFTHLNSQHWDFVIISLAAWATSIEKSRQYYTNISVALFITTYCDLFCVFQQFINSDKITNLTNKNFIDDFLKLFVEDIHITMLNTWLLVAEKESENTCIKKITLLRKIGPVITMLEPKFVICTHVKVPNWLNTLNLATNLLKNPEKSLQLWGYKCLRHLSQKIVSVDNEFVLHGQVHGKLFPSLHEILKTMQDVVQTMLLEFKLGEDSCRVEPYTDSYTFTFGYLLLWNIILKFCKHANHELKFQYIEWLRKDDFVRDLMNNLFRLMPFDVLHCTEGKKKTLTEYFTEPKLTSSDICTSELVEQLVCSVYADLLAQLPSLVRQWWADSDPKVAHMVEQVTTTYVSPQLCAMELTDVMKKEKDSNHNMKIKVHFNSREVVAVYTVDETRMELSIVLPVNYPLGSVVIDGSRQIGGPLQFRNWVMQLTMFLMHQNGSIWDGLSLWKNNLDKKFDGVEECYICFAVLHNVTYQLPKLVCQTCRKKFHSTCLYKWFSTSNKSTCPICRNLF